MLLPRDADQVVSYRFPDALDMDAVRHSDECYTCVLVDFDWKNYTFRLHLSVDGRWSLAPISGFYDTSDTTLATGWLRGGAT